MTVAQRLRVLADELDAKNAGTPTTLEAIAVADLQVGDVWLPFTDRELVIESITPDPNSRYGVVCIRGTVLFLDSGDSYDEWTECTDTKSWAVVKR